MATDPPLLQSLNPPQREAVTTTEGPVLVIAGAGSGKTRVITHRIAYLISEKGVPPWQIFAATFTNKAAREMKGRVARLCRPGEAERLAMGTFHSHCARFLRQEAVATGLTPRYTICDEKDQIAVLRDCITALGFNPKHMAPHDLQELISLAKMRLLEDDEAREFVSSLREPHYAEVYDLYQKRLRESDAVDFDDLLALIVRLWRKHPKLLKSYQRRFRYILVDEYQDTNLAQFEIVRLLAGEHRNLCVVGDEDQSIYSWRGAEITNLLEFEKSFPGTAIIRLEQNYRSTGNILDAAGAVIEHNAQRLGKTLWTESQAGDPVVVIDAESEWDEARRIADQILFLHGQGLPLDEIAVFYRANALSRVYEDALREAGIPYRVVGGLRFYDRAEIKDLLAYLQVIANPGNTIALLRIVNKPRRGIGNVAVSRMASYAEEKQKALFEIMLDSEELAAAGLKGKAAKAAAELAGFFVEWTAAAETLSLRALVEKILSSVQYEESLGDPRAIDVLSRLENIKEFVGSLDQFEEEQLGASLADYLEAIALKGADEENEDVQGVSLMTVHNAKGLEFDVVFVVALEKNIFPNARALREQGNVEEERRLFYVALTRARKRAYLSHAFQRRLYGQMETPVPSVFLYEIPEELRVDLDVVEGEPVRHEKEGEVGESSAPISFSGRPLPSPANDGARSRPRFAHEILGEVEVVSEDGRGPGRTLTVRTRCGEEHTLMAAHAALRPLTASESPSEEATVDGDSADGKDALPF
ncbi:MAG TPA: UvrD-helicase domain-containing protein [Sumerlaeia bacterium]|nr:UvrD-helicase domain-containing protein [Sumerlaeia bacterium]